MRERTPHANRLSRTNTIVNALKRRAQAVLAELYQVQTKALNQAVRRNRVRFPADFMFQLSEKEFVELNRSQFVTGSQKHCDPRSRPYAFTEQGVAVLSSVLRSKRAIVVNIEIMRAFVKAPTVARFQHRIRSALGRTRKHVP